MSKTIDFFAISPSLQVTGLHTFHSKLGSDHTPAICTVSGKGWSYTVATWNVEDETRQDLAHVLAGIDALFAAGCDVLLLQEVGRYKTALRRKFGKRLQLEDNIKGADDCAVLVAHGVTMSLAFTARLTKVGWITVRGGTHPGQALASAVIDGRFRASSGHMPVSVTWRRGIPVGPPMRVAAWIFAGHMIPRFVGHHSRFPHVLGQDWNNRPTQTGAYSPQAIAKAAGLRVHAPSTPTHA